MKFVFLNILGTENIEINSRVLTFDVDNNIIVQIEKNKGYWISGIATNINNKWLIAYVNNGKYFFQDLTNPFIIDLTNKDLCIEWKDKLIFSTFSIKNKRKTLYKISYINICNLNILNDIRMRGVSFDIMFGFYEAIHDIVENNFWQRYPYRYNETKKDLEFKN